MNRAQSNMEKKSQLPGWLWPNSNILPQFYKQVWEAVRDDKPNTRTSLQREVLVDTNKIFPLLLTSQLPTDILGYIWSLANKKYAGQLTEQELYIVLALVALAQASYPFNSLQVLQFIRVPPIPTLNVNLINQVKLSPSTCESQPNVGDIGRKYGYQSSTVPKQNHQDYPHYNESSDVKIISHTRRNRVSSSDCKSHASSSSTDSGDEFSEFQSAPLPIVPNIAILDSKQGSAIGSRLANHNLGGKKLHEKTKKSNPVKSYQNFNTQTSSNYGNASSNTRDSLNRETLPELFPKCTIKSQAKMTVILKDTAIRNNETLKNVPNDNFNPEEDASEAKDYDDFGNFVSAECPPVNVAPSTRLDGNPQDLMNLQPVEDKYSALRALVEESIVSSSSPPYSPPPHLPPSSSSQSEILPVNKPYVNLEINHESTNVETLSSVDDFGDFVSAEQPNKVSNEADALNVDLLTDFDFHHYESSNKSDPSLMQEISEAFNALSMEANNIQSHLLSDDKFDTTYETVTKDVTKEDTISVNSIEIGNNIPENLPRSASVPSLDLKFYLVSSQEEEQPAENMHQMIYSEWKQYMESCVLLLQTAASIFTSITSETVLREVLASAQGYSFLCNLAEVAAVCRRVNFSHKEMDINIMGFDDLLMDIDKIWAVMEPFYADIPIVSELPVWPSQNDNITCALCLTVITSDGVVHNDNNYHLTCANLWLNCVNSNLPVLRYASNH